MSTLHDQSLTSEALDMEAILFKVILQLAFIIATARIFAALFKKLGQPGVCGEMAAGLILGPSLFGKIFPETFHRIFDPSVSLVFMMFAQVGLVLLLFLLGMDFEFNYLRTHGRRALAVAMSAMAVPFTLGLVLAKFMYPYVAVGISETGFVLFAATALSITALPILGIIQVEPYRIGRDCHYGGCAHGCYRMDPSGHSQRDRKLQVSGMADAADAWRGGYFWRSHVSGGPAAPQEVGTLHSAQGRRPPFDFNSRHSSDGGLHFCAYHQPNRNLFYLRRIPFGRDVV